MRRLKPLSGVFGPAQTEESKRLDSWCYYQCFVLGRTYNEVGIDYKDAGGGHEVTGQAIAFRCRREHRRLLALGLVSEDERGMAVVPADLGEHLELSMSG